jgi:hypothetical protein
MLEKDREEQFDSGQNGWNRPTEKTKNDKRFPVNGMQVALLAFHPASIWPVYYIWAFFPQIDFKKLTAHSEKKVGPVRKPDTIRHKPAQK